MTQAATPLRVAIVGAGYFAPFHVNAWQRIPEASIAAICDLDADKAKRLVTGVEDIAIYTDWVEMLRKEKPQIVDIVSPPSTHFAICLAAAEIGAHVVCQKPLTPTFDESRDLVEKMAAMPVRFMVHENWRWQPWYRKIKSLLNEGVIGAATHMHVLTRLGDGWGTTPYSPRQPFFREYPRLLLHETGVHFFDTFRFLFGEVERVYATLRRTNPVIAGEDAAVVHLKFRNGITAVWDASRYTESQAENPRLTFGEMCVDGLGGSISVQPDASLTVKVLGEPPAAISLDFRRDTFAGDCVYQTQRHFVDQLLANAPFESEGADYLRSLQVVEAAYQSASEGVAVIVAENGAHT